MGKIVDMTSATNTSRGPNPSGSTRTGKTSPANFSFRLFLIVDVKTFALIEWLRESLEAPSYGDVVRQAVRAFAIILAERDAEVWTGCVFPGDSPASDEKLKRLNVRVPNRTKERLDLLKEKTGRSYTDIIICGLIHLSARARDEESLLDTLERASENRVGNCAVSYRSNSNDHSLISERSLLSS